MLVFLASLHPKNRKSDRRNYPQLWYCWPVWTKRIKWIHTVKTWLCSKLTGHEWSETEWGYGGGKMCDRWCRWCDKFAQIPVEESPPPNPLLADLVPEVQENRK